MINEAEWEQLTLEVLAEHGWEPRHGSQIQPGTEGGRASWAELVRPEPLAEAMRRLNPAVPASNLDQALAEILAPQSTDALAENFRSHQILTEGYRGLSYLDEHGIEQNPTVRVVSPRVEHNRFEAVQQVTLRDREHERRFDVVGYVNGLPLLLVELKRAGAAGAGLDSAHAQLATYLREFGLAFRHCALTIISDGITARYGTPWTPLNHYAPWNVDDDGRPITPGHHDSGDGLDVELTHLLDGVGNQERLLQLLHHFIAFDSDPAGLSKRIAKPHQYFAVTKAVGSTVDAVRTNGKAGVVWHTQGSGKSMEMELYAHLVRRRPELKNPTLVVVTDRTELDSQLLETFQRSQLVGDPVAVTSRDHLRTELSERTTGGIYFTTLQKFGRTDAERAAGLDHPLLSERRNIVVVVDEAHRSHYDQLDGYARHIRDALPGAAFIAFTGTPISFADRNTQDVFGAVIDTYDLTRAVSDGATVPVLFEPRLVSVAVAGEVSDDDLDTAADEYTLGLDDVERSSVEAAVAVINAVYGAPSRLRALAADLVAHWEHRREAMTPFLAAPGKALVVGGTRDICARLYEEVIALRPDWHSEALDQGVVKVVYSGSASDQPPIADHVRREGDNKRIRERLKDVEDPLQLVIVKDMMLTGFDAPPLHTLYLDRPLKGALLMQTLARVNRTFRGKTDGLLVAYAPLAENLNAALAEYTEDDRRTQPVGRDIDEAAALTGELLDALDELCTGHDWRAVAGSGQQHAWIKAAVSLTNWLRSPTTPGNQADEGEESVALRFRRLSGALARSWALAGGNETLADRRVDAKFYEEVRVWMAKYDAQQRQASGEPVPEEIQRLLAGLVATSAQAGEVVDIYAAAGLATPRLSDLGPDYLQQAQQASNPHLAIEALRDLLTAESSTVARNNLVRQRAFSDRIRELMNRYTNQQLTSAEVIAELVELAREVSAEADRGAGFDPPLSSDELAFYDAVSDNESAVREQGGDVLAQIARDLVQVMRRDVKTDWTVRDDVRAKLRSSVKRLLVKHRYPPDQQPEAIRLVIEQMEQLAARAA